MANKQINELSELTTASGTDLVLVYDLNESGSEKTKKMQIDNFIRISGWQLVEAFTLSNESWDETFSWDGSDRMMVVGALNTNSASSHNSTLLQFNSDTGSNYTLVNVGQNNSTPVAGKSTNSFLDIGMTGYNGWSTFESKFFLATGMPRAFNSLSTSYRSDAAGYTIVHNGGYWSNTVDVVSSVRLYSSGGANATGTVKVYKWVD